MNETIADSAVAAHGQVATVPMEIWFLMLVLGAMIFLWDLFDRVSKSIRASSGLHKDAEMIALKGSDELPAKEYISVALGLSSKPHAIVKIDDHIIPVDRWPGSRKVHDRHVIQQLVHMRLIEAEEGVRPPYGIVLLGGEKVRTVRIKNSPDRQRWLDSILDEIRFIADGGPSQPTPSPSKCKRCDVRTLCDHSAWAPKTESSQPNDEK